MQASLDFQKAIRNRLIEASAVTSLVPATAIKDSNNLPATFPCILITMGQIVPDDGIARNRHQLFTDLHIWTDEPDLVGCQLIAAAVYDALADGRWTFDHFHVVDLYVQSTRFLRDPSGKAHGVVTVTARVLETA